MACPWLFKTLSRPLGPFRTGTLCPAKSKLCLSSGSAPRPRSGCMQCLGPVPATGAPAAMCPIAFCWDYLCQPRPGLAVCQGLGVLLGGVGDARREGAGVAKKGRSPLKRSWKPQGYTLLVLCWFYLGPEQMCLLPPRE